MPFFSDGPKSKCGKECPIDDLTYDNKCHLSVESCENDEKNPDKKLEVLHDGPCLPGTWSMSSFC